MFNFILQIIMMASFAVMVYLIGRAAPRLNEEESLSENLHVKLNNLISKIPVDKIDVIISNQLEKILRKTKLFLMKWDNLLANHLNKINKIKKPTLDSLKKKETLFMPIETLDISQEKSKETLLVKTLIENPLETSLKIPIETKVENAVASQNIAKKEKRKKAAIKND